METTTEKISDIATFLNERKRDAESLQELIDLQSRVMGKKVPVSQFLLILKKHVFDVA